MDAIIITLIIVGLLVYGLERNRRRTTQGFGPLSGTSDIVDRDRERILNDIRAIL